MSGTTPLPAACRRVRERVLARVDGALSPLETMRDLGHLEACAACREAQAEHELLLTAIRASSREGVAHEAALVETAVRARIAALGPPTDTAVLGPPTDTAALGPPGRAFRPGPRLVAALTTAAAVAFLFVLERRFHWIAEARSMNAFDEVLTGLPSWSDVVRGLGGWMHGIT